MVEHLAVSLSADGSYDTCSSSVFDFCLSADRYVVRRWFFWDVIEAHPNNRKGGSESVSNCQLVCPLVMLQTIQTGNKLTDQLRCSALYGMSKLPESR